MAVAIQIAGLATVKVDTGNNHALEVLGYTRDGVDIRFEPHFQDIPGDENGGDAGPPIDIQYMGERAIIRCELTKYDPAVAAKVTPRVYGGAAGMPPPAGTLLIGGAGTYRVLIAAAAGADASMNFLRCVPRQPIEVNKGTRFSRLLIEFEAYKDPTTGKLYDTTIT